MRILITGGAGFIGSHLCDALLSDGHQIAVLDDLSSGQAAWLAPHVELFEADIRDADAVQKAMQWAPETIVHCAAQLDVRASVADPARDADVNIVGALRVLNAAVEAGAKRFIFASTGGAIYGEPADETPVSESAPMRPESPYGLSKASFENYLNLWSRQGKIVPVVLRYSNVYGPRQGAGGEAGVVAVFAQRLLNGQQCTIFGDGTSARDYVFVGDVVEANRAALTRGDGGVFNIGTGQLTSIDEVYITVRAAVAEITGREIESAPEYAPLRPGEVERICLDASLARAELDWSPQTKFAQGVRETVEWLAAHTSV